MAAQQGSSQMLADTAVDLENSPAPIPDIPHGPTHYRFASDHRAYAGTRSKLSAFLDRRIQNAPPSNAPRMLRHLKSSSNLPYGSHVNFPYPSGPLGASSFAFPNQPQGQAQAQAQAQAGAGADEQRQPDLQPLRSLTSMTTGQSWQATLDHSRRSHKMGLAQLVSRRRPSTSTSTSPYPTHTSQPSNATSGAASSHVSTHSLSNRGPPLVPSRLSSLTAQVQPDLPDETEEEPESEAEKPGEAFESTVPDVAKWFDGLAEPGKGPTSKHKKNRPSAASSTRPSSSRAPSVTASQNSTFLNEGQSSGSETERSSRRDRHRRRSSRDSGYTTSASSRRGSDAYSERVVVTRRSKLRDSISRQGSVLSTSDSDDSDRSRILQIHLPSSSSRSRHRDPTATVIYNDGTSRSRARHRDDQSSVSSRPSSSRHDSRPSSSRRSSVRGDDASIHETRPRSSRHRDRRDDIIEISIPREPSRHTNRSRRTSRSSRWAAGEVDADAPPIPALVQELTAPEQDYRRISDPGPNADYRPPSRQPRHKSSSQNMVAQAVEESIRQRAGENPEYLSVTPAEARLLINMRKKKLAMQKQLFTEGYRHALEEELYQLEQMQAKGKASTARIDERSSFASMPDDVGYFGSQFPTPPNGVSSGEDRPIITDTIMESPSESETGREGVRAKPTPPPINVQSARARSTSRPRTAHRGPVTPAAAEVPPPLPTSSPSTAFVSARNSTSTTIHSQPSAPPSARASMSPATASPQQPAVPRANSLTSTALAAARANSMSSAAAAAAAARTKSLTSATGAAHNRNAGSRDLGRPQARAVATRQPSWIRRSDEEPMAKYQSQMQQQASVQSPPMPSAAVETSQDLQPKDPSPRISVDASAVAESPIHPSFTPHSSSSRETTPQPPVPTQTSGVQLSANMPGSWRDSEMSFSQHAYTMRDSVAFPVQSRPMSEFDQNSTPRDSCTSAVSSAWTANSPMTALTDFSSPVSADDEMRHALMDESQANRREAAVYSPTDLSKLALERQDSIASITEHADDVDDNDNDDDAATPEALPLPEQSPVEAASPLSDLGRSDTVVRVRGRADSRSAASTPPQNYSLFPVQPSSRQTVIAARRNPYDEGNTHEVDSSATNKHTTMLHTPEAPRYAATPTQQSKTAYASPSGSRSSSRVSRLPRMRGSSLPSIPITTL